MLKKMDERETGKERERVCECLSSDSSFVLWKNKVLE